MTTRTDVPAFRHRALDRLHDPFVTLTLPERAFKRALIAQARVVAGHRVLDVGCGTGRLLLMIDRAVPGTRAVGIDIDGGMLRLSRSRITAAGTPVHVIGATAIALPFGSGTFDRVLSTLALHHWNSAGKRAALAEMRRVLRPGGELHIADWGLPHTRMMRIAGRLVRRFDGDDVTADNLEGRIAHMIESAGFVDVRERDRWSTIFGTLTFWSAGQSAASKVSPGTAPTIFVQSDRCG